MTIIRRALLHLMQATPQDITPSTNCHCARCGKTYTSPYTLKAHRKTCKGPVVPIGQGTSTCSSCGNTYSSPYALRTHRPKCKGPVVPIDHSTSTCDSCGKTYSSPYALRTHRPKCKGPLEQRAPRGKTCTTCQRTFSTSYALARHVDICKGPVLEMYKCDQCAYQTPRKDVYKRHRKTCVKPYVCTLSDRCRSFRFMHLSYLECHLRNEHEMCAQSAHELALKLANGSGSPSGSRT